MGRRQGRAKVGGQDKRLDPFAPEGLGLGRMAGGADDAPALRDEPAGKGAGRIAVAKGKQGFHAPSIGVIGAASTPLIFRAPDDLSNHV